VRSTIAKYVPVVLAGGSGTRLWPLSRTEYPKQFLSLGQELSLLQSTVSRFSGPEAKEPVIVCSEQHRFLTVEQLQAINVSNATIILEPAARNTAPAIALAAWQLVKSDPEAVMVVLPADHVIEDAESLRKVIDQAVEVAAAGHMVTLGISPTGPATGYGYIKGDRAYCFRAVLLECRDLCV